MKFNLKYRIIFKDNSVSEDHEINIDNCTTNSIARIKIEKFLAKKYDNFFKLIIDNCEEYKSNTDKLNDMMGNYKDQNFGNVMSQFGDIFGGFPKK
jgi:hypothetical protein